MFRVGGVILTFMPKKIFKRNLFHHGLYIYQRLFLWLKFRKINLSKLQKQTLARCSHVQLDLGPGEHIDGSHLFLNVTFPNSKFEVYDMIRLQNESQQVYASPLFLMQPIQIAKMRDFATDFIESPRKRAYDWLQLFSYILNLIIWILRPSTWGREVNHMLNLPGGKQVCSSGAAACLRYAEIGTVSQSLKEGTFDTQHMAGKVKLIASRTTTQFFKGYDTAMISPILFLLERKWETPGEIYEVEKK